jgi:hypothetical protein
MMSEDGAVHSALPLRSIRILEQPWDTIIAARHTAATQISTSIPDRVSDVLD